MSHLTEGAERGMSEEAVDPMQLAKTAIEMVALASPGPWKVCKDGECSCKTLWSAADYPIASLEHGEWGDQSPALRFVERDAPVRGPDDRMIPGTLVVEAHLERIAYGEIPEHYATADARLIAFARTALPLLAQEVLRLSAPREMDGYTALSTTGIEP